MNVDYPSVRKFLKHGAVQRFTEGGNETDRVTQLTLGHEDGSISTMRQLIAKSRQFFKNVARPDSSCPWPFCAEHSDQRLILPNRVPPIRDADVLQCLLDMFRAYTRQQRPKTPLR